MTRHIVAYEDKAPFPGVFIEKGALKPSDREIIPVYVNGGHTPELVLGRASDFERDEETGAISFEMTFLAGFVVQKEDDFSVYARIAAEEKRGDVRHIQDATVLGIQYMPFGAIPEAFRKNLAQNT